MNEWDELYYGSPEAFDAKNHQPVICSWFACGRELTLQEQRFGNRCSSHQDGFKRKPVIWNLVDSWIDYNQHLNEKTNITHGKYRTSGKTKRPASGRVERPED